MPMTARWRVFLAVAAVTLGGCTTGATSKASFSASALAELATQAAGIALPTSPANEACLSDLVGHPITLAVSGTDVVGHTPTGIDLPIYWPPGFRAVVTPAFTGVYTDMGALFAAPGEDISPYTDVGRWGPYSACALGQGIWVFGPHGP